jgi:hypothetical protein
LLSDLVSRQTATGGDPMKAWFLSLVLACGALGGLTALPSKAHAQLPPAVVSGYRVGNYGTFNLVGVPVWRWHISPLGFNQVIVYPGAYRLAFTPVGVQQWWTGPMVLNRSFHPVWGWSSQMITPYHYGFTFSPYATYQQLYVPPRGFVAGYGPVWWTSVNWAGTPTGMMLGSFAALANAQLAAAGQGVVLPLAGAAKVSELAAQYQGYVPPQLIMP